MIKKITVLFIILLLFSLNNVNSRTIRGPRIIIRVQAGGNYSRRPQIAIWLEKANGKYVRTLFLTNFNAKSRYIKGNNTHRAAAAPVWFHKIGHYSGSKFITKKKITDTVSQATPSSSFRRTAYLKKSLRGTHVIKAEVNSSFDYNAFYKSGLRQVHKYYNGYSGQPSLIYSVKIYAGKKMKKYKLKLIGRGHASGKTGKIYKDLRTVTTAKRIIKSILVIYKP